MYQSAEFGISYVISIFCNTTMAQHMKMTQEMHAFTTVLRRSREGLLSQYYLIMSNWFINLASLAPAVAHWVYNWLSSQILFC